MGSVIKRIVFVVAALAMLVPGSARAETVWYTPSADSPFAEGPQGGGGPHRFPFTNNEIPIPTATVERDVTTGEATALQHNLLGISGGLGCIAASPFTSFEVSHTPEPENTIEWVTVTFADAIVSPYSFIKASVLDDDGDFIKTVNVRGAVLGAGTIRIGPLGAVGPVTARFGVEVSSACPSTDGATARFTGVAFAEI